MFTGRIIVLAATGICPYCHKPTKYSQSSPSGGNGTGYCTNQDCRKEFRVVNGKLVKK